MNRFVVEMAGPGDVALLFGVTGHCAMPNNAEGRK